MPIGSPRLTIADGTELFDTAKDGNAANDSPEKVKSFGEMIAVRLAAAGTGVSAPEPSLIRVRSGCGSFWRAFLKCA